MKFHIRKRCQIENTGLGQACSLTIIILLHPAVRSSKVYWLAWRGGQRGFCTWVCYCTWGGQRGVTRGNAHFQTLQFCFQKYSEELLHEVTFIFIHSCLKMFWTCCSGTGCCIAGQPAQFYFMHIEAKSNHFTLRLEFTIAFQGQGAVPVVLQDSNQSKPCSFKVRNCGIYNIHAINPLDSRILQLGWCPTLVCDKFKRVSDVASDIAFDILDSNNWK